jgi:opacity protein-like surface antigen
MKIVQVALFVLLSSAVAANAEDEFIPQAIRPPPNSMEYLVTGIALSAEAVVEPADMCPETSGGSGPEACILERGLGLGIRAGYRTRGPWYAGGTYQFSRHESSNLLRLAIMQQLRAEMRYYFDLGTRASPYLGFGLGAVIYGNEWGAETGGAAGMFGPGVELTVTQDLAVGAGLFYRPMLLRAYTDSTGERRAEGLLGFGTTHLLGLELIVELRDPIPRW